MASARSWRVAVADLIEGLVGCRYALCRRYCRGGRNYGLRGDSGLPLDQNVVDIAGYGPGP